MQPQQGLNSACSLGDRLACDAAEFEGQPAGLHTAATAAAAGSNYLTELGLALLPLLLLGLASRLWHRRRGHSSTALRGRRLQTVPALGSGGVPSSPVSPDRLACGAATQLLPPHPAVGRGATGSGGSNTRGTLLSAIDTAVSLLLLPISLVQTLLRRGGTAAAPATPVAPGPAGQQPTPNSGGRGMHYGLGIGEAESEDEEEENGGESELTQAALRRLQQSDEFRAYLQARSLTTADVGDSARKLRLYRRLRRMDPAAFWQMLRPGSRTVYQSRVPSRLVLAADYLLSIAATLAALAAGYSLAWGQASALPAAARAVAAAAVLGVLGARWLGSRPTLGPLFGLWYEELQWGHAAPGWRCAGAALLEAGYVLGSAGIGAPLSLALRCLGGRRQSVGELLAGVAAVQEVAVEASGDGDGDD